MEQEIRFCTSSDGARIAYATVGNGPPLVKAANWLSHLEHDWNSPVWRHWLRELSRDHTLVRYDERGCGLSDWEITEYSLDAWVRDLESVVDSLNLDRFPLLGISQGGPIAMTYALRHPEKVSHLILYGSYGRGAYYRICTPQEEEERELLLQLVRLGWGKKHAAFRQVFTSLFIPDGTPEQIHMFNELQRVTASPENAARMLDAFHHLDVRPLLGQLEVPTLVLHVKGDMRIPFEEGRLLASAIKGARFVPLEGRNHILMEHEPSWQRFLKEIRSFLGVSVTESKGATAITGERWEKIGELFEQALELKYEERDAYLKKVCAGDTALQREVESLLGRADRSGFTKRVGNVVHGAIVNWWVQVAPVASGQTIRNYRILEKLGEGGMGIIFKARDLRLDRTAALKLLPDFPGIDNEYRRRFLQEAKAAAALDHPNICTIYEIEETDEGHQFIAMPYYEGETLKDKIARGPLPIAEVVDYAIQTGEGLAHAHQEKIIHRDIKPANVLVTTQGRVKILDFGIAKVSDVTMTRSGVILGTMAYMSPEQALGEPVDDRSDLWSLGVVLYEMLSGRRPFTGSNAQALLVSILNVRPPAITEVRPDTPHALGEIVEKLLQKDPSGRYASATDFLAAMKTVGKSL